MYLACLFVLLLYEYEYKYEALILLMGRLLLRKKYFAENGKTSQNPKNQTEPDLYSDSYSDCDSDSDSDSDSDPEWATSRHSDGFVAAICVLYFVFYVLCLTIERAGRVWMKRKLTHKHSLTQKTKSRSL